MPRKKRSGKHTVVYAELPDELAQYLDERAARHNRTKTGELSQILSDLRAAEDGDGKKGKKK